MSFVVSLRQGDIIRTKLTHDEPLLAAAAGHVLSKGWKCTFMSSRITTSICLKTQKFDFSEDISVVS